ncbi:MAG: hypothetical protein LBH44_01670 [Treponema sp.]|jgi:hypothetical protein|nr:hypothetical protein [Treponema sp.]
MSGKKRTDFGVRVFRFTDFLVIVIFISLAAFSLFLFWIDLNQTFVARNKEPVGFIINKNNVVERRMADRGRWDRLSVKSSIYVGDTIRVAEPLSSLTFTSSGKDFSLMDYTFIRIAALGADGSLIIEGNVNMIASGSFTLNDTRIDAASGMVNIIESGDDGIKLQVLEGSGVKIINKDGQLRELNAGEEINWDASGNDRNVPAAVVTQPKSNAHFLNKEGEPLSVNFSWNRKNLGSADTLRLEIAHNRDFTQGLLVYDGLFDTARTALDPGLWHWRLSWENTVLCSGRFNIVDAAGPELVSPPRNTVFHYQRELPNLFFQWSEKEEASHYILEASETPDFANLRVNRQVAATSFIQPDMGQGTWYWRVMPVFSSVYEGSAAYSPASSFRVEQDVIEEILVEIPEPEPEPKPPPPLLPAPGNRLPAAGVRIGINELRRQRTIEFRWSAVPEANAYIFTLYQQTQGGRRQIIRREPDNRTSWTLRDLSTLDRGTFIWQVEAVSRNRNGTIERRGIVGENTFILDIPPPTPIQLEDTGVLYGN